MFFVFNHTAVTGERSFTGSDQFFEIEFWVDAGDCGQTFSSVTLLNSNVDDFDLANVGLGLRGLGERITSGSESRFVHVKILGGLLFLKFFIKLYFCFVFKLFLGFYVRN